jgi:hypothetical protein
LLVERAADWMLGDLSKPRISKAASIN